MRPNWAITSCLNHDMEVAVSDSEFKASSDLKRKAGEMFQSSRTLHKFGWNKEPEFFIETWEAATDKSFQIHEMSKGDLKKFKWELADRESWLNGGFGKVGDNFLLLDAKLQRIPGGKEMSQRVHEIVAYQRRETVQNNNRIQTIVSNMKTIGKDLGVDLSKLSDLEMKLEGTKDVTEQNRILYGKDGIQEFLGAINTEGARTRAGDLYLSIRDVMENKPIEQLQRTNPDGSLRPWNTKHQQAFQEIQNNWFQMRKDLSKVLLGALRTQKKIIAGVDRTEGGRRRLTEYVDRLEQYIKIIEFEQTSGATGRQYDIDGKDLAAYGLEGGDYKLRTDLGYMPHYILTMTEHVADMTRFAHESNNKKTAFEQFSEMVNLMEGNQGVINRAKGRANLNQEYYSRNPLMFLSRYTHEVTSFNKRKNLEIILQDVNNMFTRALRNGEEIGARAEVEQFTSGAAKVLQTMEMDLMPAGHRPDGFIDKSARFLTALAFTRTMVANPRSAIRNKGQFLMERIKMGYMSQNFAKRYMDETNHKTLVNIEAEKHGLVWSRSDIRWGDVNKEWKNTLAGTKGSIEESALLPGLKEVTNEKGERQIVMDNPSMVDKMLTKMEAVAVKGSKMHSWVETKNRHNTFRAGWARAHSNLSKTPAWYIETMMGREVGTTTEAQRHQWINTMSGKLAYGVVTDVHYEYGRHQKADILKGPAGQVLGQFQHYRFSLFKFQHNILKRGWRDIKAGVLTGSPKEIYKGEGARQLVRLGLTHSLIDAASMAFGVGFINVLANDNLEWIKNMFAFFTAERDESGNLTEDGLAAAQQATYGSGTFSLLGPTVGGIVEFGTLMNFWEVNNDHYISFLSAGSDEITTDDSPEDKRYKQLRLLNIQAARVGKTWEAFANQNYYKAFLTETGLFVPYEYRKSSKQFMQYVRDLTGTKTTGNRQRALPMKRRRGGSFFEQPE